MDPSCDYVHLYMALNAMMACRVGSPLMPCHATMTWHIICPCFNSNVIIPSVNSNYTCILRNMI